LSEEEEKLKGKLLGSPINHITELKRKHNSQFSKNSNQIFFFLYTGMYEFLIFEFVFILANNGEVR
jgi:hypothetical protein